MEEEWIGTPWMVGTCPDMCPAAERELRERLQDISIFERLPGSTRNHKISKDLAVKKFSRTMSGASLRCSEIRPLPVLQRTMKHLIGLLDRADISFAEIYNFVFDRTRSVRQELAMQRIGGQEAIDIYVPIVRFHILAAYELCDGAKNGPSSVQLNGHLNMEQLSKALTTLLALMESEASQGRRDPREGELWGYHLLLQMGSFQSSSLSWCFRNMRLSVLKHPEVKFARALIRCSLAGNYLSFCRLAREATYLQACLVSLHLPQVREMSLEMINGGCHRAHPYPLKDLSGLLLLESEKEAEAVCVMYKLPVGPDSAGEMVLLVKQATLQSARNGWIAQRENFIERKRLRGRAKIVSEG